MSIRFLGWARLKVQFRIQCDCSLSAMFSTNPVSDKSFVIRQPVTSDTRKDEERKIAPCIGRILEWIICEYARDAV